jgi:hypothetical protein
MTPGLPAERDGVAAAAIARSSGAVVADPGDPAEDAGRLAVQEVALGGSCSRGWRGGFE